MNRKDEVKEDKKLSKKEISFRITSSMDRRNVDKHIVRFILYNYDKIKDNIIDEYAKYGMNKELYENACQSLFYLKIVESNSYIPQKNNETNSLLEVDDECNPKKPKRDYGKAINEMLNLKEIKVIMKCCLELSLKKMKERPRMKPWNKEIYIKTIEDYLGYIKGT